MPSFDDHRHDLDRALHIGKQHQQIGFRFRQRHELIVALVTTPQRPFRADVEALQVVTETSLTTFPPSLRISPVGVTTSIPVM